MLGSRMTPSAKARAGSRGSAGRTAPKVVCSANGYVQPTTSKPMDVVFVSAEVAPWSKTGGLGDVVGGLPIELVKRGHRVMTIAPRYDQYADCWDTSVTIDVDGESVRFFHAINKGVHRVFIDHPWFLAKVWGKTGSKLYGAKSGADYLDNHKRFAVFCKAAIEATRALPFGPGEDCVFVANDWHSALVPVLLKDVYQPKGQYKNAKTALCIHNIAFQGRMWEESIRDMGLPKASYERLAFTDGYSKVYTEATPLDDNAKDAPTGKTYKKINWLKAGILSADKLVTVSPNYATEITADAAKGVEMDKYLKAGGGVEGIVNGMDIDEWNPKTDKYLTMPYDVQTVFAGKAAAKEALQAELGLPVDPTAPLFAFIGRLEEQKGVDIMLAALPKILASPKAQVAILGTGKAQYEKMVNAIGTQYKGRAKGVVKFSAPLAHLMTAGGDFMLVPSRFEPCGLIQLHAMHYGTVPVVASTGGLVDTVKEGVTGFHMGALNPDKLEAADAEAMGATCRRAADVFATPRYREMVFNCISQDLSWARPAQRWEGLLEQLVFGTGADKKDAVVVPVLEMIPGPMPAVTRSSSSPASATTKGAQTAAPMGAYRASRTMTPAAPAAPSTSSNGTAPSAAPSAAPARPAFTTYTTAPRPATAAPASAPAAAPAAAPSAAPAAAPAAPAAAPAASPKVSAPSSWRALVSSKTGGASSE